MFEFWPQVVGGGGGKVNIMKMFKIVSRTLLTGVKGRVSKIYYRSREIWETMFTFEIASLTLFGIPLSSFAGPPQI